MTFEHEALQLPLPAQCLLFSSLLGVVFSFQDSHRLPRGSIIQTGMKLSNDCSEVSFWMFWKPPLWRRKDV